MKALLFSKVWSPRLCMLFTKVKPANFAPKPPGVPLKAPATGLKPSLADRNSKLVVPQTAKIAKEQKQSSFEPDIRKKHAVVTIMGHVDHGKTTLIDYLRSSDIAQKQDGGITQRISAFRITCKGERISFIDTPGHEAFTNMRQRGATVTDLVVLVVSGVEGVKKQTLEVIELIKKMDIPIIVAISKIDLPEADPETVQKQLKNAGLNVIIPDNEDGSIPVVHISAKTGLNVQLLCELIVDQTKQKTAVFNGLAEASVLQAFKTKQGLNSMTIIMEKGTLKIGSNLVIGTQSFKVKTILDDRGQSLKQALPGEAIQIVGIPFIPAPGDHIYEVENEKKAKFMLDKNIATQFESTKAEKKAPTMKAAKLSFEKSRQGRKQKRAFYRGVREVWMNKFADEEQKLTKQIQELRQKQGNPVIDQAILELEVKLQEHKKFVSEYLKNTGESADNLNFIIKFGDRGMEQTILMQLETLKPQIQQQTKVKLNLIKTDIGDVTVKDVEQAATCYAQIFTYACEVSPAAREAVTDGVMPRTHKLIHTLLKDIKEASFEKRLKSIKGIERGACEVADLFQIKAKKKGQEAVMVPGIKVITGKISKTNRVYIFRNGIPVSGGLTVGMLKSFKKDMMELKKGEEGTISFNEECPAIEKGDQLRFFEE